MAEGDLKREVGSLVGSVHRFEILWRGKAVWRLSSHSTRLNSSFARFHAV